MQQEMFRRLFGKSRDLSEIETEAVCGGGSADGGAPEGGTPDGGAPDGGAPDGGNHTPPIVCTNARDGSLECHEVDASAPK
jgi:hypothetical protein